jgi:hypothetical protein
VTTTFFQGEKYHLRQTSSSFSIAAIAVTALLAPVRPGAAQEQGWPINHPTGSSFPWNAPDYRGYDEPLYVTQVISPSIPAAEAQKYGMNIRPLPMMKNMEDPNAVTIVATCPMD